MINLYYGNGNCSVSGSNDIKGIQIFYTGKVAITDKTPEGYEILVNEKQILIFPISTTNILADLFDYTGSLKIKSALIVDSRGQSLNFLIKRVMDYADLLNSNAEDMTTNSEDLKGGYRSGNARIKKSSVNTQTITNLNTNTQEGNLYLESGEIYEGEFHIHKKSLSTMTGAYHTGGSRALYIKKKDMLISTKKQNNPSVRKRKKFNNPARKMKIFNKDGSRVLPRFPNKDPLVRKIKITNNDNDKSSGGGY